MSLSSPKVVSLLNRFFVPVYVSNEDYTTTGSATVNEKSELRRIFQEGYKAKLSVGTVHVYILKPDGHLLNSMHVAEAAKLENIIGMLDSSAQKLGAIPGNPIVPAHAESPPVADKRSLRLHLTARYLQRNGDSYKLIESNSGDWSALPSEDWIVLTSGEQAKLIPAKSSVGYEWKLNEDIAAGLLQHFYPPTENWETEKNEMESCGLNGRVLSLKNGIARIWLVGSLRMKHSFYHKEDQNVARATVKGWMNLDMKTRRIETMNIVTDEADYGDKNKMPYGVAVTSSP